MYIEVITPKKFSTFLFLLPGKPETSGCSCPSCLLLRGQGECWRAALWGEEKGGDLKSLRRHGVQQEAHWACAGSVWWATWARLHGHRYPHHACRQGKSQWFFFFYVTPVTSQKIVLFSIEHLWMHNSVVVFFSWYSFTLLKKCCFCNFCICLSSIAISL